MQLCAQNDDDCIATFEKAIEVIDAVGKEDRDVVRTTAYTQKIVDYCTKKYLSNKSK